MSWVIDKEESDSISLSRWRLNMELIDYVIFGLVLEKLGFKIYKRPDNDDE